MKITKVLLLERGFAERCVDGHIIYVKGHHALFYVFGVWLPCYYAAGTILAEKIYINTMEELDILEQW